MQISEQNDDQKRAHLYPKGVSGHPAGRESKAARVARRDAIMAQWAEPFGGLASLRAAELELLRIAAELSMCRPRNAEDRVRHVNAIARVMAQLGFTDRGRRRAESDGPSPFDHLGIVDP